MKRPVKHIENYYLDFAAAFIRGRMEGEVPDHLISPDLIDLTIEQKTEIYSLGIKHGLKLHKFKRTMGLARVRNVIGILKGLRPENLLDIGTGRGIFLWPLLDEFPNLQITAIDTNEQRIEDLNHIHKGGFKNLQGQKADVTALPFTDDSFEVVTALEVLEHIPGFEQALAETIRVAKRFVIVSVPTKEDDNPDHIHLIAPQKLSKSAQNLNCRNIKFDYVLNHMIAIIGK